MPVLQSGPSPPLTPAAGSVKSSPDAAAHKNGASKKNDRSKLIPCSARLKEGRAVAPDVWSIFSAVNLPSDCIHLGQGYMDFAPPKWMREAATQALKTVASNQYTHPKGSLRLREALKSFYGPRFIRSLDVETEILVTGGASAGQYSVYAAFLDKGDEVILFEPFFDQYLPSITFIGGKPVYVSLHPPKESIRKPTSGDWSIDIEGVRRVITPRTKMIVINSPHNPVGKVFTKQELESIAAVAEEFNLLVMSDEVYDSVVFDGKEHVRFANLPGMWDRTVTVGSAGKAFSATGWRVGWLIGPKSIIQPAFAASRIVHSSVSPLQEAIASGLEQAGRRHFFEIQLQEYTERRAILCGAFDRLGLRYSLPEGSYYVLVDISGVKIPDDYRFPKNVLGRGRDFRVCWFIANEVGVSSIPVSEFYCKEHTNIGEAYARFSFCKDADTLRKASERLQKLDAALA